MGKKIIITIERQCGSGGEKIGKALAEKLGIACFDREILIEASRETNVEEQIFENCDEIYVNVCEKHKWSSLEANQGISST